MKEQMKTIGDVISFIDRSLENEMKLVRAYKAICLDAKGSYRFESFHYPEADDAYQALMDLPPAWFHEGDTVVVKRVDR